jgi:extracellular elastinolytic metalloproteinase
MRKWQIKLIAMILLLLISFGQAPARQRTAAAADVASPTGAAQASAAVREQTTPPTFLTGPNSGEPLAIARQYIHQNAAALGLSQADLADMVVKDQYSTKHNGVTHIYFRQRHQGIEVYNGDININIGRDGAVISLGNRFVSDLASKANVATPVYSAADAVRQAAVYLHLPTPQPLQVIEVTGGPTQAATLGAEGLSKEVIPVKLVYFRQPDDVVRLAWQALIHQLDDAHVWNVGVDAVTGTVIHKADMILDGTAPLETAGAPLPVEATLPEENRASAGNETPAQQPPTVLPSYRVFAPPLSDPDDGPGLPGSQTVVRNPADSVVSPFGWHDIDGLPGHDFQDTRGNNVFAQEDRDGDDLEGFRPTGRQPRRFNFDYRFNPAREPSDSANLSAGIVNLFYWINHVHDVAYHYGFDEASGNFQMNNYERGGLGGDAIQADAQDGFDMGLRNNAYFLSSPDGFPPRIGMFVFDLTTPNRDGSLDNGVITHEYMHGISTRLVGGPSAPFCLDNPETMGEGWSDLLALALTAKSTDTGARARGMGTYLLGQPPDGPGIRRVQYSTDMAIDPQTYGWLQRSGEVHDTGEVWASMVWDMHWALVDQYGFDPNLSTGTGGNNLALRLIIDGMKFTACNPGFVDARDGILTADLVDNGGANQCTIWQAFSRRGLGYSADQGSPFNTSDGHEAFDLPPICRDDLSLTKSGSPTLAEPGELLTYTLTANNYTSQTVTGLTISDPLPANVSYVPGSASDGGTEAGGVITWQLPDLNPDEQAVRTFAVRVNRDYPEPVEVFSDTMESGAGNWIGDGLWHWQADEEPCGNSFSPTHSWYFGQAPACTYQDLSAGRLTTSTPISLPKGKPTLTFQSWEEAELCCDPRMVLASTDGENFTPIWFSSNSSAAWYKATADLSAYSGQSVWLRFEFSSDFSISFRGWYVDDVRVMVAPTVDNTATLTSNEGLTVVAEASNQVIKQAHIAVDPPALEETLKLGTKVERTLTISNTGTAPLEFSVAVQGTTPVTTSQLAARGSAAAATPAMVDVPGNQAAAKTTRSYAGERIQARSGFRYQPKLNGLTSAEAPKVLLLAAGEVTQIQALLAAYPDLGQVDTFDARSTTPTIEQLLDYDTVIVIANNPFLDPVAIGDVLADYVDQRGTVVQTTPTFFDPAGNGWGLRGRWLADGYSPFIGTGDWFTLASLGPFDETHPIMQGVDEASDSFRQVMDLAPGASLVASWTDDEFVATQGSVVALNTFLADGYVWTGDIDLIVHNSIVWLQSQQAGPVTWLTVTPVTGTVSMDGSLALQVTIDASVPDLVGGDHTALLRISSNDPARRVVDVPVTLHALGPKLSLGEGSTWYGRPVTLPISLTTSGFEIAATTFSVDMDESCLRFDKADADHDGIPDAIHFSLPAGFQGAASFDPKDTDGELDFFIADLQPPLLSLPDGVLGTIEFSAACLPDDSPLTVGVNFSTAPVATASDQNGVGVAMATIPGTITVQPGLPGDCNKDGVVNAGDTTSCVLEIFDGDGFFWQDAPGGSFPGSPQGCDSNQDNRIDAADIACTVLIIFNGQGACKAPPDAPRPAAARAAALAIPSDIAAAAGATVTVPITLNGNGNAIAAAMFGINYDQTRLSFDPTDGNGDGIPDAIDFNLPSGFVGNFNLSDSGQLQFVIADMAPPLAALPDGTLATITLRVKATGDNRARAASIAFATDFAASLGSQYGQSMGVTTRDGSVLISPPGAQGRTYRYLPFVGR